MKTPKQCKGCRHFSRAGHKQGTAMHNTKYDAWCCRFSRAAKKALGECKMKGGYKSLKEFLQYTRKQLVRDFFSER